MGKATKGMKQVVKQILSLLPFMVAGGLVGNFGMDYLGTSAIGQAIMRRPALGIGALLLSLYLAFFIQVIAHEAGHMVFGLLTGYGFSSFRVGSLTWVKMDDRIRLKRLGLAGTGGQCLMTPPELKDGRYPVMLYNLGGSLMNLLLAGLCGLLLLLRPNPYVAAFLAITALLGLLLGLLNGIPIKTKLVNNDGHNALMLTKDATARQVFWQVLAINEQQVKGLRLKEMPGDWFELPDEKQLQNGVTALAAITHCQRLLDEGQFQQADMQMARILQIKSGLVGLNRQLMQADRLYCLAIAGGGAEGAQAMMTKEYLRFVKAMKRYPAVLRTQYALALLCDKDQARAEQLLAAFDKQAQRHPNPAEIACERALIAIAQARAQG